MLSTSCRVTAGLLAPNVCPLLVTTSNPVTKFAPHSPLVLKMFDGRHRTSDLSLVIETKTEKQRHIERVQKERTERLLVKQRTKAATTIQATYRAHRCLIKWQGDLVGQCLQLLADANITDIGLLLRKFNFCGTKDAATVQRVVQLLLHNEQTPDEQLRYSWRLISGNDPWGFTVQVKRLVRAVLPFVDNLPLVAVTDFLRLLGLYLHPPLWKAFGAQHKSLLDALVEYSIFPVLAALCRPLCTNIASAETPLVSMCKEIAALVAFGKVEQQQEQTTIAAKALYAVNLLAIPYFWNGAETGLRLPMSVTLESVATGIVEQLPLTLNKAALSLTSKEILFGTVLRFLGLLAASKAAVETMVTCVDALKILADGVHAPLLQFAHSRLHDSQAVLCGLIFESGFVHTLLDSSAEPVPVVPQAPNPFSIAQANPFSFTPPKPTTGSQAPASFRLFGSLCELYCAFLRDQRGRSGKRTDERDSEQRLLDLLSPIAYSPSLIPRIWKILDNPTVMNWENAGVGQLPSAVTSIVDVFSESFTYYLTCTDEEEFYTRQPLFPVNEVVRIAQLLKDFAYRMYDHSWKDPYTRSAVTALVRKLYELDCRRRFCPPNHWLARNEVAWPSRIDLEDFETYRAGRLVPNSVVLKTLNLLQNLPFLLPFATRVELFRFYVAGDAQRLEANFDRDSARVRRDHLFDDAFAELHAMPAAQLKMRLRIEFISPTGTPEAGFGEGVTKEFITELSKVVFSEEYALFRTTPEGFLFPNPAVASVVDDPASKYRFLGRVIGKALYDGILVDVTFARFFRNLLLSIQNSFADLRSLDPELYRHLLTLKYYERDVEELGLNFTVVDEVYGEYKQKDLVPGGSEISVTNANRMLYIRAMYHYR
eukprot:TRINITY_DN15879_c0_g1_i1.p1 TRINITY_DN15879_c0_g1~~TRINITY_DN15879_c0_g1_i1.p1  ORF type:complete len:880 (-),score=107.26 TRINITY_DN15879_c0_g1_i1:620-3259(-)